MLPPSGADDCQSHIKAGKFVLTPFEFSNLLTAKHSTEMTYKDQRRRPLCPQAVQLD